MSLGCVLEAGSLLLDELQQLLVTLFQTLCVLRVDLQVLEVRLFHEVLHFLVELQLQVFVHRLFPTVQLSLYLLVPDDLFALLQVETLVLALLQRIDYRL